jgi:erythromycin esterase-like protein
MHKKSNAKNSLLIFSDDHTKKSIEEQLLSEENGEGTRNKRRKTRRGQRAIGVVYNPAYERYGNYVPTELGKRYDSFLYVDKTHGLHPLHMPEVKDEDLPETFPTGL